MPSHKMKNDSIWRIDPTENIMWQIRYRTEGSGWIDVGSAYASKQVAEKELRSRARVRNTRKAHMQQPTTYYTDFELLEEE